MLMRRRSSPLCHCRSGASPAATRSPILRGCWRRAARRWCSCATSSRDTRAMVERARAIKAALGAGVPLRDQRPRRCRARRRLPTACMSGRTTWRRPTRGGCSGPTPSSGCRSRPSRRRAAAPSRSDRLCRHRRRLRDHVEGQRRIRRSASPAWRAIVDGAAPRASRISDLRHRRHRCGQRRRR